MKRKSRQPCPKCNGKTYLTKSGPHVKWSCYSCGYLKFLPVKNSLFIMPFGKYKGKNIDEIIREDIEYAKWVANNLADIKIKTKFAEELKKIWQI